MSKAMRCALGALALATCVASASSTHADHGEADVTRRPTPIIFDTDLGNDVDDVLALGMIHALQSRGACELLAVTVTKDHPLAAPFVDAVNAFYGRGDLPIGVVRGGPTPDRGRFLQIVDDRDGGAYRYPHDLASGADAPDATRVLRDTLAKADDGSVVIVQVGFSTNLARLLDSPGDDASELSGRELVKKKVRLLSLMAGSFPSDGANPQAEYNVKMDMPSFKALVERWPTEMIFSGLEVGLAVTYPAESIERDFTYAKHHPLADAYRLYEPPPHNRPCWDLTSVIYAVRPYAGDFGLSPPGRVSVDDAGITKFEETHDGLHRYLTVNDEQAKRLRQEFVRLCSAQSGNAAVHVRDGEGETADPR